MRCLCADDLLQPLLTAVRYKLAFVLQDWHPSDASALNVIAPWQGAFKDADLQQFMARSVLPKLQLVLRSEFAVNPQQQYLDPFKWVMTW